MAQNDSPTWDRKFGNLCQVIWKTFHHSQPSKKPSNSGSHMLVHVCFVETTSIRLVSFNLWIQNQVFLHGFLVLSIYGICVCMYMYVCMCVCVCSNNIKLKITYIHTYIYIYVIFNFMLLEHYLCLVDVDLPLCLAILYCVFLYGIIWKFVNLK